MSHTREDIIEKGLIAALELAGERSWSHLTLSDIATAAGLKLSDFHGVATTDSLADATEGYFDKAMSGESVDLEESPRERLFDVIMLRFEAMEPYREGLKDLMNWRERSPVRLLKLVGARKTSADWALVSAGLDGTDQAVPRDIRAVAVAFAMARAERAWRKETDPGFARTMAELDKALRQLEEGAGRFSKMRWGSRRKPDEEGEAWEGDPPSSAADGSEPEGPPSGTSPA
ncbi:MAG: hypothetical protein MRY64_08425 [Hyphomonadaceae bacterium]|nr:hypothetical protein [Hyphomonadaceae bacterium]